MLQVILNIMYGSGMELHLGVVTGYSEHYVWLRYGGALGVVMDDSEHYVWLTNVSAIGCCYG
jgi:hypothetical protein